MAQKRTNHTTAPRTQLQHNYVQNPITALAFYHAGPGRVFLLAGEDTWLKVYDVAGTRLLGQLKIFSSQPIHGLHVSSAEEPSAGGGRGARLLVWGAHSVAVLPEAVLRSLVDGNGNGTTPTAKPRELRAPDWIYDAILFPSPSDEIQGVLVTAHNEIVPILRGGPADGDSLVFGPLTSPSRPILYSANLCLLSPDTVLVAGGTVFGEIIVWMYYLDSTRPTQWEVLFVFTGHEGSIFGVSISPELELAPGVKVRLLASCSDDRTIRVWDVTDRSLAIADGGAPVDASYAEARETGFGGNSEVRLENRNDASRCLAVAMGHVSRIWHVKFTGRGNHHTPRARPVEIYSFGEDCYRQKWELSLDLGRLQNPLDCHQDSAGASVGALKSCGSISCHSGKNIWSCAVLGSEDGHPIIATGGADGRIAISGDAAQRNSDDAEAPRQEEYSDVDMDISLDQVLRSIGDTANNQSAVAAGPDTRPRKGLKDAFFLRYSFLSEQTVLATSSSGRLLLGTVGDSILWRDVALPDTAVADLKSYNIVKSPVQRTAVLGSASGQLYLFQDSRQGVRAITKVPGKISDIICVRDPAQDDEGPPRTWTAIVTAMSVGFATMLTFDTATGDLADDQPQIQLPPGLIVTAAAFCGGSLVLGSRVGHISIYRVSTANCFTPVVSRKDCKAKDAITCIVPLPGSPDCFLTGCRDGRYRIYTIGGPSSGPEPTTLHLQHEIAPPLGMIEGAWFTKPDNGDDIELILHGFRGNNFVIWNETSRQELATVECGGAHRPFDYVSPAADPGQIRLIFTKAAQLRFYSQRRPVLKTLKEGGHGREMRAVAACGTYIATAAEDTTVRIWQHRDSPADRPIARGFKCLAILEKHSAGIQCLRWLGTDYLLSSAGGEELYIWRVTRLASDYAALAVVCEAAYPDRTADGDLRILDFDVAPWAAADDDGDPGVMVISLVLSNSTFKTYLYSPPSQQPRGFQLLAAGHYTGACLTQIRHLRVSADEVHVLTASTDGHLVVWTAAVDAESESGHSYGNFSIAAVTKLHQSTVKCLDLFPYPGAENDDTPCRWMVVTGGDDSALGFLDLAFTPAESGSGSGGVFSVVNKARVRDAHAAAVTGVRFVIDGSSSGDSDRESGDALLDIATVSNDQRVKLWRVETRGGLKPPKVSLLSNQYSSVADPGDLEVIARGRLMVGGVGAEVWDVSRRDGVLVKGE
ncbi:WD40-repeat-containing domain protein [Podospora appendiculata]|uniref:WD40-repeat-containing domain protein n=1 Tax=Podospora appendiculata TaxID=314037 RepID=A0AAE1CGR1_9PEZI|nr:WD40-repeat-containing domain protein [Podospora appendiculata]